MTKIYLVIISALLFSTLAYADVLKSSAQDPDDLSKKAQQEAINKTKSQKYHQHDKKVNPNQTAAQTQARHGGSTATNVTIPKADNTNYNKSSVSNKSNKKKKN